MRDQLLINRVQVLRSSGKTYGDIRNILKEKIPKSTLSYWCRRIPLPTEYNHKIKEIIKNNAAKGRAVALLVNKKKRKQYLETISRRNAHLPKLLKDKDVAKLTLAILYLTEGSRKQRGSLTLGNSDPMIIRLFLKLLRLCYVVDEEKLRCTLQCRADQKIKELEEFWSKTTNIPLNLFYKAQIDPRTIDRPSKNLDYKGVCRINYFSANVFNELKSIYDLVSKKV